MIVVADTSPLNYLILLGRSELLPDIYGRVLVPDAVLLEMQHPDAPPVVRAWAATPPSWLEKAHVEKLDTSLTAELGAGEREAISLALALHADVLLIDERAGRREAGLRNLFVAGTLFVLLEAARLGRLELPTEIDRLRQLGFYVSRSLETDLLTRFTQQQQGR